MRSIASILAITNDIDRLGAIKAAIAELNEAAESIKRELIAAGEGAYQGAAYDATVSRVERSFIDADAARKVLSARTLAKITRTSSTYTVRVTARVARKAA